MKFKRRVWVGLLSVVFFGLFTCGMAGVVAAQPSPAPAPDSVSASEAAMYLDLVNQGRKDEDRIKSDKVVFRRSLWRPAVLVGYATDAQSVLLGSIILDGTIHPVPAGSKVLLGRAGWEQANLETRRSLALRFVKEVLLGFDEQLLEQAPSDFPKNVAKSAFRAPKVVSTQTGGVQVEGWILEAPHTRGVTFRRSIYWFGNNGQLMRAYLADRLVI